MFQVRIPAKIGVLVVLVLALGCSPAIKGNTALKSKDYDTAIADFKQALKADPNDHFTRSRLGQAYYRKGQMDKAVKHLELLLSQDPADPEAPIFLGLAYLAQGQRTKGFDSFRRYKSNIYREVRNVNAECDRLQGRLEVSLDEIEHRMFQAIADGEQEQRQINQY